MIRTALLLLLFFSFLFHVYIYFVLISTTLHKRKNTETRKYIDFLYWRCHWFLNKVPKHSMDINTSIVTRGINERKSFVLFRFGLVGRQKVWWNSASIFPTSLIVNEFLCWSFYPVGKSFRLRKITSNIRFRLERTTFYHTIRFSTFSIDVRIHCCESRYESKTFRRRSNEKRWTKKQINFWNWSWILFRRHRRTVENKLSNV